MASTRTQLKPTNDPEGLCALGYDPETSEMFAEFKSGNTYRFDGVPKRAYTSLRDSPNKRAYLRKHFNGRFQREKI